MNGNMFSLSDAYLVQGAFFQGADGFRLSCESAVGVTLLYERYMGIFQFSGLIHRDVDCGLGSYRGYLTDRYGKSVLTDIELSAGTFCFSKTYKGRDYAIKYTFVFQERAGTWVGTYNSERTGAGFSRCVLMPITNEFFQVPEPEEALSPR